MNLISGGGNVIRNALPYQRMKKQHDGSFVYVLLLMIVPSMKSKVTNANDAVFSGQERRTTPYGNKPAEAYSVYSMYGAADALANVTVGMIIAIDR